MLDGDRIIPYVIIGTHGLEITLDAETLRRWRRSFTGSRRSVFPVRIVAAQHLAQPGTRPRGRVTWRP